MDRPDLGPDIERMTAYCTYCPKMCRFTCPAANAENRETVTPWGMMRLLEVSRDGSVALDEDVADAFYHCTGCRRCQTFCLHGNDVPAALWKARSWVVEAGYLPRVYKTLQSQFDEHQTPYEGAPVEIDDSAFDAEGTIAFWPDCATVRHRPEMIGPIGRLLSIVTGEKVRLIRSEETNQPPCCGFPLTAAGIEDAQTCKETRWPSLNGLAYVWTDCPSLAAWNHPESSWQVEVEPDEPSMGHIFELLAQRLPHVPPPEELLDLQGTLLHESCFVARQIDGLDAVHTILEHICKNPPEKMAYHGAETQCCGGRVAYRMLEPEASDDAARAVFSSLERHSGCDRIMTTSSMCDHALGEGGEKELVSSLLDLLCQAYNCT